LKVPKPRLPIMSASRGISITASQIFYLASPQYTLATTVSCTAKNLCPKNGHQDSCPRLTNTHITILHTAVTSENYPQNFFTNSLQLTPYLGNLKRRFLINIHFRELENHVKSTWWQDSQMYHLKVLKLFQTSFCSDNTGPLDIHYSRFPTKVITSAFPST